MPLPNDGQRKRAEEALIQAKEYYHYGVSQYENNDIEGALLSFQHVVDKSHEISLSQQADIYQMCLSYLEHSQSYILQCNEFIEKIIIQNPEQWIWSHNRWK